MGTWHAPAKRELPHSTVKIPNRKAIFSGLYKTTKNSTYILINNESPKKMFSCVNAGEGSFNNCTVCNLIIIP